MTLNELYNLMSGSATNFFENVTVFNSVMFLIAVFSIIITLRAKPRKSLVFYSKTVNLTSEKIKSHDPITVLFAGQEVENISLTQLALWNKGNQPINFSDVAVAEQIRIESEESVEMYGVETISTTEESQNVVFLPVEDEFGVQSQRVMNLSFDYIEPGGGVLVQIIHTGQNNSDIFIDGVVKGYGQVKKIEDYLDVFMPKLSFVKKLSIRHKRYVVSFLLFLAPTITYLPLLFQRTRSLMEKTESPILIILITLVYWIVAFLIARSKIPKKIEPFSN